ncbi:hypothetical protein KKH27_11805 [bacterium]|nr:hypothetical protein [bacterium]MBU1983830.1 hypothetical protein [bacterium]
MAAKPPKSELLELLKLLRRILVLAVAVYGLVRGMPYDALLFRLAILWAVLYICSGVVDTVFRRLSFRTTLQPVGPAPQESAPATKPKGKTAEKPKESSRLPAVSGEQAR